MKKSVFCISLGCPKNYVDSEILLGILIKNGYELTDNIDEARMILINTCAFIESAQQEAINTIIEVSSYKGKSCLGIVVAGCLAQRFKEQIIKELPEVDAIVGPGELKKIAEIFDEILLDKSSKVKKVQLSKVFIDNLDNRDFLEGVRAVTDNRPYKYVKIAEGCDNKCTYCVRPSLRGCFRSRKIEDVEVEVFKLVESGCKEVILVAQDTTRYGQDLYGKPMITELIKKISKLEKLKWIRFLYCYPEMLDDNLINELKTNKKLLKYLDIPIQHASDEILTRMNRRGDSKLLTDLFDRLRKEVPGITLRTSLIVGFPGETQNDFDILMDFVEKQQFERAGVFDYSKQKGTLAYSFSNQVPARDKRKRLNKLMQKQKSIMFRQNKERMGKVYEVLVEGVAEDGIFYFGRSYMEAPSIDNLIYFTSSEPLSVGEFVSVKILNTDEYDLIGEVVYESTK